MSCTSRGQTRHLARRRSKYRAAHKSTPVLFVCRRPPNVEINDPSGFLPTTFPETPA
jgi:hypothetical protein